MLTAPRHFFTLSFLSRCRSTVSLAAAVAATALLLTSEACAVESIHFGWNAGYLTQTDAIRRSTRTGVNYWSQNRQNYSPETGAAIPYAYHDGYIEDLGTTFIPTAAAMAQRWREIMTGQGDSRTGVSGASIGIPDMMILDELNSNFRDSNRGPILREALRLYTTPVAEGGQGGSRNDITAYIQPGLSQGTGVTNGLYDDVIFATNNYMRSLALEVYATEDGYRTGIESPTNPTQYQTGDAYIAQRVTQPLRNWMNRGLQATRVLPVLNVSNIADSNTNSDFNGFLNRQFWFMANGRYSTNSAQVDANIVTALRQGVGSYTWAPDVDNDNDPYQLLTSQTTRDSYFEAFLKWYSVDGNTSLHSLTLPPPLPSDFNGDGYVDSLDLTAWRTAYGATLAGDADNDGDSDGADFLAWQRQLGAVPAASPAAVAIPEPASCGLLAIGLLAIARCRIRSSDGRYGTKSF